ncbi:MAG: MobF family relaxase [Cyanobacteria bacterium J06634_5]
MSNVSAAQAENYYDKDDYYTQGLETEEETQWASSQWAGKGAIALGLTGEVDKSIFKRLLQGEGPSGQSLHARKIDLTQHRAGTDYTFSAPKSVSIAGLIQQDWRVMAAHDRAVETALTVLEERYAQTRVRTKEGRLRITTGNIVAAVFRHETSRAQDPQLHSHCVVINTTQMADGSWRSLSNEEIVANQKLLGEIYQNELAYQLRQCGYEIEPMANGQFKIRGYEPKLLEVFSTRRQQILDLLETWSAEREAAVKGSDVSAARREAANLRSRRNKRIVPREVLMEAWQQEIHRQQLALPQIPQPAQNKVDQNLFQTRQAVQGGINHAAEREAVFRRSKVERFVLENHLGQQSFTDLQRAIQDSNELIRADSLKDKFTTQTAIQRELETIRLMQEGKGMVDAIASSSELQHHLAEANTLTKGQRHAIELSTLSRDHILAWQGVAGSGKTYSLKLFSELAVQKGYTVRGFAPSAEAAHELAKATHIPSDTVASLLVRDVKDSPKPQTIWIVDEAGLLSAKAAHQLLQRAAAEQARVILVGDTRQLSAVEAGNPFKSLQAGGIQTAYLEESRRQKTEDLKKAIALIESGQLENAIQHLDQTGAIQAIPSQAQRFQQIVDDYLSLEPRQRDRTLLLAGTNAERLALTAKLRQAMQERGELGADVFCLRSLRNRNLTTAQASYASYYEQGDVLVPSQDYKRQGLVKYQHYRVVEIDHDANRLRVETPHGQLLTINPARCQRKTAYAVQEIAVVKGDRLRWTRNNRTAKIRNGQRFTVADIDSSGNAQIVDDRGNCSHINLRGLHYIDSALVGTTYSSQGKTADRVLALMDTTSRESFYVAASRAKHHLSIYTADTAELAQLTQRSRAKENASDYIPLFQVVTSHAKTQKENYSANTSRINSRNIGESLGDRIAQNLTATLWRDSNAEAGERQNTATDNRLHSSTSGYSKIIEQLEQAGNELARSTHSVEPDADQIVRAINQRRHWKQLGEATALLEAIGEQFGYLKSQVGQQQQLSARIVQLLGQLKSVTGIDRHPRKSHYQTLWNHYSQGIQADNPCALDRLAAAKALGDGNSRKDIALMLASGSLYVRHVYDHTGRQQAMLYVQKTVEGVCQQEKNLRKIHSKQEEIAL